MGVQARDERKRELLKANGIDLLEWKYDQVVSLETVMAALFEQGQEGRSEP